MRKIPREKMRRKKALRRKAPKRKAPKRKIPGEICSNRTSNGFGLGRKL